MKVSGKFQILDIKRQENGDQLILVGDVSTFKTYLLIVPMELSDTFQVEVGKVFDLKDLPVKVGNGKNSVYFILKKGE